MGKVGLDAIPKRDQPLPNHESTTKKRSNPLLDKVTGVEYSSEPFAVQLDEVLNILGLDADAIGYEFDLAEANIQAKTGFSPAEEWAFRWLLKQFNSSEKKDEFSYLQHKSWILLRTLVARLPLPVAARLLNEHHLQNVLFKTITLLCGLIASNRPQKIQTDVPVRLHAGSKLLPTRPRSSPETRKRKRDQESLSQASGNDNEHLPGQNLELDISSVPHFNVSLTFTAACSFIEQIMHEVELHRDEKSKFASELTKFVFRYRIAQATELLDGFMKLILSQIRSIESQGQKHELQRIFVKLVQPSMFIWQCRDLLHSNKTEEFRAFCATSLISVLELLSIERYLVLGLDVTVLERLLIDQSVSYSQSLYLESRVSSVPDFFQVETECLFDALGQTVTKDIPNNALADQEFSIACHPISVFYELSLKQVNQVAGRYSVEEEAWIHVLFATLVFGSTTDNSALSSRAAIKSILVTDRLLELTSKKRILLRRATIEALLSQLSKIASTEPRYWRMVSHCIEIDFSVVTFTKGFEEPGDLVTTLLQELSISLEKFSEDVRSFFIMPLLRANIRGRKLSDFIIIWKIALESAFVSEQSYRGPDLGKNLARKFWTHPQLRAEVAKAIQSQLTIEQVVSIIEDLARPVISEDSDGIGAARVGASSVVIQTILEGINLQDYLDALSTTLTDVLHHQAQLLVKNSEHSLSHVYLWQNAKVICSQWPDILKDSDSSTVKLLQDLARDTMLRAVQNQELTANQYESAYQAFAFVCSLASTVHSSVSRMETNVHVLERILEEVSPLLALKPDDSGNSSKRHQKGIHNTEYRATHHEKKNIKKRKIMESQVTKPLHSNLLDSWDTTIGRVGSSVGLMKLYATLLIENPWLLEQLSSLCRATFLDMVHNNFIEHCRRIPHDIDAYGFQVIERIESATSWHSLWDLVLGIEAAINLPLTCQAIRKIQLSALGQLLQNPLLDHARFERDLTSLQIELHSLQKTRFELWNRKDLAYASNYVHALFLIQDCGSNSQASVFLSLLGRLLTVPSENMDIIKEPLAFLKALGRNKNLSDERLEDFKIVSLQNVSSLLMDYMLLRKFSDLTSKNIKKLLSKAKKQVDDNNLSVASWTCMCILLQRCESNSPNPVDGHQDACSDFLKAMAIKLVKIEHVNKSSKAYVLAILEGYIAAENYLYLASYELSNCFLRLKNSLNRSAKDFDDVKLAPGLDADGSREIREKLEQLTILLLGENKTAGRIIEATKILKVSRSSQKLWQPEKWLRNIFTRLDTTEKANFLTKFISKDPWDPDIPEILILGKVMSLDFSPRDKSSELEVAIRKVLCAFLALVERSKNVTQVKAALSSLDMILQRQAWAVSQSEADGTLLAVTICASRSGSRANQMCSSKLVLCLCTVILSILRTHRLRVVGRYHLLGGALQALLSCLFEPYTNETKADVSDEADQQNASHSTLFSRLLTTICDPSRSNISRSKQQKSVAINDEIKEARRSAGEFMRYLLIEFCDLHLSGQLAPAVRSTLMPGLYAVFNSTTIDMLKSVNIFLDPSRRAIYKSLYEEYKKFGVGDKG